MFENVLIQSNKIGGITFFKFVYFAKVYSPAIARIKLISLLICLKMFYHLEIGMNTHFEHSCKLLDLLMYLLGHERISVLTFAITN